MLPKMLPIFGALQGGDHTRIGGSKTLFIRGGCCQFTGNFLLVSKMSRWPLSCSTWLAQPSKVQGRRACTGGLLQFGDQPVEALPVAFVGALCLQARQH